MKYLIIKLCCYSCNQFLDFYFTDLKPNFFISTLDDFNDYSYMIFNLSTYKVKRIDGCDLL